MKEIQMAIFNHQEYYRYRPYKELRKICNMPAGKDAIILLL